MRSAADWTLDLHRRVHDPGGLGRAGGPERLLYGAKLSAYPRCFKPALAAEYIVPPSPFRARVVSVRRLELPPGEPVGRGPSFKRLYVVSFDVIKGNAVLPAGHRYSQFAYVTRKSTAAPWCFLKGGSGP